MSICAALAAIVMWSSLATLTTALVGVPPFFLAGMSLLIGGMLSIPWTRHWSFDWRSLTAGTYGQFTYHALYVFALRNAPAVNANLVHYVWPFLILLMAPLAGRGFKLSSIHIVAAVAAFAGVAIALVDGATLSLHWFPGYGFALAAAFVWASYSIAEARNRVSSIVDVGPVCMLSGLLALGVHVGFEVPVQLDTTQWVLMFALGVGPTGGAFYLWSWAMRRGDTRLIGVLSNAAPILSTVMLAVSEGQSMSMSLYISALLVTTASLAVFAANRAAKKAIALRGAYLQKVPSLCLDVQIEITQKN